MNKIKNILLTILDILKISVIARKNIAIRFFFTVFYVFIWGAVNIFLFFLIIFQFIYLILTTKHSEAIKTLCHKLAVYNYKILRYISLNENEKPYPLGAKFPQEMEPAEETDLSTPVPEKQVFSADEPKEAETVHAEPVNEPEPSKKAESIKSDSDQDTQEAIILDHKE